MLRPLNIISRLDLLLESAEAIIIDMSSLEERRTALNTCRAPALGWDDYIRGEVYEPPTKSHDITIYYGPKDGTGWTRDKDGRPVRVPSNPNSEKYGGVRPWSPDEIAVTMMDPRKVSGQFFPYGLLSIINRSKAHAQAARPGIEFKPEDYMGPALDAMNQAVEKDMGKVGTEFTKYLALQMDLTGGAPPGLRGEHRTIRGILTKLLKMLNRIATQVESGDFNPQALLGSIGGLGSQKAKLADADPSIPRRDNLFGGYAGQLKDIYHEFEILLNNGDGEGIRGMGDKISQLYEQVEDDEARYSGEGMAHGVLGSQPRDLPAIGTQSHRIKATKYHIYVVDPDVDRMDMAKINKAKKIDPDDIVLKRDSESGAPLRRHYIDLEQKSPGRAISAAVNKYAEETGWPRIMVAKLPFEAEESDENVGAGFHGVSSIMAKTGSGNDDEEVEHPGLSKLQQQVENDPEFKEEVTELLHTLRYGSAKQRVGQARRAVEVVKNLLSVIDYTLNPKPRPQLKARPDARVSGKIKSGGFDIIDVDRNQIVARADGEREASRIIDRMNNPVMSSLQHVASMLSRAKLGNDYHEDLSDLAREVVHAMKVGDREALDDAVDELQMTKRVASDEIRADPEEHAPMVTDREYRVALRKLGISDYPEKGTVNDPEIDEEGNLSSWAQAGYPIIMKDTNEDAIGKGTLAGTLYEPGAAGDVAGEVMSDKHISTDLGISAQSVGKTWLRVRDKLSKLAEQLYEHHVWAGDLDDIDLCVLRETCNRLAVIMIEEIRLASRIMIEQLYA